MKFKSIEIHIEKKRRIILRYPTVIGKDGEVTTYPEKVINLKTQRGRLRTSVENAIPSVASTKITAYINQQKEAIKNSNRDEDQQKADLRTLTTKEYRAKVSKLLRERDISKEVEKQSDDYINNVIDQLVKSIETILSDAI
jgi:thymidylate synthase